MSIQSYPDRQPTEVASWNAIRAAAALARQRAPTEPQAFRVDSTGALKPVSNLKSSPSLHWHPQSGWRLGEVVDSALRAMARLYLPYCNARPDCPISVGHLGQSLDGFVATANGDSYYVTGPENIIHLHRMRALCDAVLVGAGTVAKDDPQLTTRRVSGDSPLRVVLDPNRRLSPDSRVFQDSAADTLLVCRTDRLGADASTYHRTELLGVTAKDSVLDLEELSLQLRSRGVVSLFVEGGGYTVSRMLEAGLLNRLQIAVAPVLIGDGRPSVRLPPSPSMGDCLRPRCEVHQMGSDVLFDCDLSVSQAQV
jgi:riboflavin-specific deaminase-like protein